MQQNGVLYICPTPIGNLEDITLRALRVLEEVDLIAAEDTRRTVKLLNHYQIKTSLTSYYEYNKEEKGRYIIGMLLGGKSVALVSDAGTPGISDPGEQLIGMSIEHGIKVISLPGASATTTALVASGLSTERFFFQGFLPRDKKQRRLCLEELKDQTGTIVIYVSPHRLMDVLEDCKNMFGSRRMVIARELTKRYEEFIRGEAGDIINSFKNRKIKGEMVLLVEGASSKPDKEIPLWQSMDIKEHILWNIKKGLDKKAAIQQTALERGISKKHVYEHSFDI